MQPQNSDSLFRQLYEMADQAAAELSRPWFDKTLFSCRSTIIRDYVAEAEATWQRCQGLAMHSAQRQWLYERLDKQLNTLVQALYRGKPPKERPGQVSAEQTQQALNNKQSQDLLALYQQLKTYKEYEVRLADNLRVLQQQLVVQAQNKTSSMRQMNEQKELQQKVLYAQQRLQRCQKAIAGVDRAIAKLER